MKSVPILRTLDRSRVISPMKILSAGKFAHLMIDLGWRAGYTGKFSPYAMRRGHGNAIDRELTHPKTDYQKLMCSRSHERGAKAQTDGPQE